MITIFLIQDVAPSHQGTLLLYQASIGVTTADQDGATRW
jgi:hypothetical protein